jgi:hypothetical protein
MSEDELWGQKVEEARETHGEVTPDSFQDRQRLNQMRFARGSFTVDGKVITCSRCCGLGIRDNCAEGDEIRGLFNGK